MAGSVQTDAYRQMIATLIQLRYQKGWSQADLAKRLGKPPSFVGKYELAERRLDVVEVLVVLKALGEDPLPIVEKIAAQTPENLA